MENWLQIVISVVGGGGFVAFLNWILNLRKDKREGMGAVISLWKDDNARLREEMTLLKSEFENLRSSSQKREKENGDIIQGLRIKVNMLESAHLNLPIPQWLKDKNGTMLSINSAYEELFGKTVSQYVGNTDYDVWPKKIADQFKKNDTVVKRTRKHIQTQEMIEVDEHVQIWEVLKYPRYEGSTFIGIGGIAFKLVEGETTSALT